MVAPAATMAKRVKETMTSSSVKPPSVAVPVPCTRRRKAATSRSRESWGSLRKSDGTAISDRAVADKPVWGGGAGWRPHPESVRRSDRRTVLSYVNVLPWPPELVVGDHEARTDGRSRAGGAGRVLGRIGERGTGGQVRRSQWCVRRSRSRRFPPCCWQWPAGTRCCSPCSTAAGRSPRRAGRTGPTCPSRPSGSSGTAGSRSRSRMPMITTTTSSSMRVKPPSPFSAAPRGPCGAFRTW